MSVCFYANGFIEKQIAFKNGLAEGNAYYFYPNGVLKARCSYHNDLLDGFRTDYVSETIGFIKSVLLYRRDRSSMFANQAMRVQ